MNSNLSYQYYIAGTKYFNGSLSEANIEFKRDINDFAIKYKTIHDINYNEYYHHPYVKQETKFTLKTTYPGLLVGGGYSHGAIHDVKKDDKKDLPDFSLGFYFDHTTGFPIIPGSSIKGVLKSVFPKKDFNYKNEKMVYMKEKVASVNNDAVELIRFDNWEEIFFGKLPKRKHIFCDAYLEEIPGDGKIFEEDYMTSHTQGIFKNPTPIRFLKIAPDIKITFQFVVFNYQFNGRVSLTDKQITGVFKQILLDFGIGAKRNVGYGQFIPVD